jgi:hypothetical protein
MTIGTIPHTKSSSGRRKGQLAGAKGGKRVNHVSGIWIVREKLRLHLLMPITEPR